VRVGSMVLLQGKGGRRGLGMMRMVRRCGFYVFQPFEKAEGLG
jgi:hypothetical protein